MRSNAGPRALLCGALLLAAHALAPAQTPTGPEALARREAVREAKLEALQQELTAIQRAEFELQALRARLDGTFAELKARHEALRSAGTPTTELEALSRSLSLTGDVQMAERKLRTAMADVARLLRPDGGGLEAAPTGAARARSSDGLVRGEHHDVSVHDVLRGIVQEHGVSIVHAGGAVRDVRIDARFDGVPALDAVQALLTASGHSYEMRGRIVVVTDSPGAPGARIAAPTAVGVQTAEPVAPREPTRSGPGIPRVPAVATAPVRAADAPLPEPPNTAFTSTESVKPGINEGFLDPGLDVDRYVDRFEGESREIFAQRTKIARALGLGKGDAVADIGAGTGLFLDMFAKDVGEGGKLYAVDLSPKFIEHLKERVASRGYDHVEVVQCTERSATLPPASVDKVFICDTYHHFEYPAATMASIREALRPGGELLLVDFERIPGVTREWLLEHVRAGKAEVLRELDSFGFEFVEELEIPGLEENYCVRLRRR